jgi:AraC-like DNA-binding protein
MQRQSARFQTVEELCQLIDTLGWDSDVLLLDKTAGDCSFDDLISESMVLSRFAFSNKIHQRAMPLEGYHTFGLLAGPQSPAMFSGQAMDLDSMCFMNPRHGLDAISDAGFVGYTVALQEDLLAELADRHNLADPASGGWKWSDGPLVKDPGPVYRIRQWLKRHFDIGQPPHGSASELKEMLALAVLRLGNDGQQPAPSRYPSRNRARRRALEYLRANRRENVTVQQLCEVSACSISTLERAFLDEFGVTPKRYILQERLSGARRAMLERSAGKSITQIASDWGFTHMGKFAADYRRTFGELPSQTRRGVMSL